MPIRDTVTQAVFSRVSSRARRRVPAWLLERPIAHRGLHDEARPENSLPAFEAAVAADLPIELDVHRLADGRVAVFHDVDLARMTGASGSIVRQRVDDLGSLRLGATDARIPLLDEVLDLVDGRVPLVIDVKNEHQVGALERAVVLALRDYVGPVALQSFNPLSLAWFRRHAPEYLRGLLASDFRRVELPVHEKFLLRRLLLAFLADPDYVGYELRCLPYWAPSLARRLGLPLVAWTVRTPEDLARAIQLADNVIFEAIRP